MVRSEYEERVELDFIRSKPDITIDERQSMIAIHK